MNVNIIYIYIYMCMQYNFLIYNESANNIFDAKLYKLS